MPEEVDYPRRISQTLARSRQAGGEFLIADLELAMAWLDRAALTADATTRARNVENATRVRDTVVRLLTKIELPPLQSQEIRKRLQSLEERLEAVDGDD
jgi:hypothetical protein